MALPTASTARKGSWRRPTGRRGVWLFACLILAGVGTGLAAYPYPPLPAAEIDVARAKLQVARRAAGSLAPEPLALAESSARQMEQLYAQDRARWPRFTRLDALDAAIADTLAASARALSVAHEVHADRSERVTSRLVQLQDELRRLEPGVDFLPPGERRARSAAARAGLALSGAAAARRDGRHDLVEAGLQAAELEVGVVREALEVRYRRFHEPETRRRWQAWADETVGASRGGRVSIVVDKLDRRLYLFRDGRVAAKFDADLGRNALSDKFSAGDGATPEGRYRVTEKRANGSTQWYKALLLDYPNDDDWKNYRAMKRRGEIPQGRGPGGLIEIHGLGGKRSNWTDGCVAVPNAVMDRLFAAVPVGTPVTIVGTARLPDERRTDTEPG